MRIGSNEFLKNGNQLKTFKNGAPYPFKDNFATIMQHHSKSAAFTNIVKKQAQDLANVDLDVMLKTKNVDKLHCQQIEYAIRFLQHYNPYNTLLKSLLETIKSNLIETQFILTYSDILRKLMPLLQID